MIGIYKITNPNGLVYIGQTIDYEKRIYSYSRNNCKDQRALYNSLVKYGYNRHKVELIKECAISELSDFERYYQEFYNSVECGLNCVYVTSSDKSGKVSDETKRRMSIAKKGIVFSDEHKLKLSIAKKGGKQSGESKMKKSESIKAFLKANYRKPSCGNRGKVKAMQLVYPTQKGRAIIDLHTGIVFHSVVEAAYCYYTSKQVIKTRIENKKSGLIYLD